VRAEPYLAFDIGGTRVKAGIVEAGAVTGLRVEPTGATFDEALGVVGRLGDALLAENPAAHVAACVPGIVDGDGTILALPGKLSGAEGASVRDFLAARFSLPATVCNDAIAYGAGEAVLGAGAGFDRVVVITIGTGIGVTVFEGGRPMGKGPFGGGALGGQVPIAGEEGLYQDTSGRTDTIEAYCRVDRIVDFSRDAGGTATTPRDVFIALRAGNQSAIDGVGRYRQGLTRALVALAHAHAPDILVVGGGPAGPGSPLLDGIEGAVNERLFGTYRTRVRLAAGGDSAALLGLGQMAQNAAG